MVYILYKCSLPNHKRKEFHEIYEKQMKLLEKNGGKLIGIWDVELGPCSQYLLIWAAEDLAHYEKVLHDLVNDPEGKEIRGEFRAMSSNCERWLLRPTSYSPLQ